MASKIIESPEQLWGLFEDYKLAVKSDPFIVIDYKGKDATPVKLMKEKPLTMEGFELYVADIPGMPWELGQYFANRDKRYENFVSICSRIRQAIRNDQIAGGMAGIYNPSITQRLNGLVDKTETKVVKEQPLFADEPEGAENGQENTPEE